MPIVTMDGLIAALEGGQKQNMLKQSASSAAGRFHSLWRVTGRPAEGAIPPAGSGAVPVAATIGAVPMVNPPAGMITYLGKFSGASGNPNVLLVYDRLVHTSGLVGNSAVVQTLNSVAVNRPNTSGEGVEIWLEAYAATGGTAVAVTANYTNQAGVAGRLTPLVAGIWVASAPAGFFVNLPLAVGDTGVRSVQSIQLSATTGTAGNIGVTLVRRLAEIPFPAANVGVALDAFQLGLPRVAENACIALAVLLQSAASGIVFGTLDLVQG